MEMPDVQHMAQGAPLVGAPGPARKESAEMKNYPNTHPSRALTALIDRFPILNQLFDNPNRRRKPSTCPICGRRLRFEIVEFHGASYPIRMCPRCSRPVTPAQTQKAMADWELLQRQYEARQRALDEIEAKE